MKCRHVVVGALSLLLNSSSLAQVLPDAGQTIRELERAGAVPQPAAREVPNVQLPAEATPSAASSAEPAEQRIPVKGFRVIGATSFPTSELEALVQDWAGKELTLNELQDAAARITRFYRERDFLVARAHVPAQTLQEGVVRIVVLEGRLGKLEVRNQARLTPERAEAFLADLAPDTPLLQAKLDRSLLALNDLPGVERVNAVLQPGASVGLSDVVVTIDPAPLVSGVVDVDNYGNRFTGQHRLGTTLFLNSPLHLGDQLSARAVASDDQLYYGRIAYRVPVGGSGLMAGAAYSASTYRIGGDFAELGASGDARIASVFASYPLLRRRSASLALALSLDRKSLTDRINLESSSTDKSVHSASIGLVGNLQDTVAIANFSLGYTDGRLHIKTPAAREADDTTARTNGDFAKWVLAANGIWAISGPWTLHGTLSGQLARNNLDSSEKFVLGGADAVRAYPQGEAATDEGYVINAEVRYAWPTSQLGTLQLGAFVDYGWARMNKSPFNAEDNTRQVSGAGLSLNWNAPLQVLLRASLAWKLGNEQPRSDRDRTPRGWLQAVKYF